MSSLHLFNGCDMLHTSIIDQHINASEHSINMLNHRFDIRAFHQVVVHINALHLVGLLNFNTKCLDLRRITKSIQHDIRASLRQRSCASKTNATRTASDQRYLVREIREHFAVACDIFW